MIQEYRGTLRELWPNGLLRAVIDVKIEGIWHIDCRCDFEDRQDAEQWLQDVLTERRSKCLTTESY